LPSLPLAERYLFDPYGFVADFDHHFENLRRNMESLILPTWNTVGLRPFAGLATPSTVRADFCDEGDAFVVELDVPGFERDDIDIELTPKGLEVEARHESESKEERLESRFLAHERSSAALRRAFTFPEEVLPDKAEAELKQGVLRVRLPKQTPTAPPKPLKVKVK
jgi:HSP20 family protein